MLFKREVGSDQNKHEFFLGAEQCSQRHFLLSQKLAAQPLIFSDLFQSLGVVL